MNTQQQKQALREKLIARRSAVSEETYLEKSAQIISRLKKTSQFKQAEVIHCYVSMNARREVNTHPLIRDMLDGGKKVVVPITEMDTGRLTHLRLGDFDDLKKNSWGVLEPQGGEEVSVDALDLVVVPMAGGDCRKNRIGYGKGFYDRFLAQVDGLATGLLFEQCLVDDVPTESFDVPLDILITENEVIH